MTYAKIIAIDYEEAKDLARKGKPYTPGHLEIIIYGNDVNGINRSVHLESNNEVLNWLAENNFIPISETFFYKP